MNFSSSKNKKFRTVKNVFIGIILAAVIGFLAIVEGLTWGDYDHVMGEPQYMIILGCQVKSWGPSASLKDRLDEALDYLDDFPDVTIVVSGAQGKDEPSTEAKAMFDYLVEAGVPAEQIWLEENSYNTLQNLQYSVQLLEEKGCDLSGGVIVVSNGLHLTRVRMLWERVTDGKIRLSTLAAPLSDDSARFQMYFREPLALMKSWLLDKP